MMETYETSSTSSGALIVDAPASETSGHTYTIAAVGLALIATTLSASEYLATLSVSATPYVVQSIEQFSPSPVIAGVYPDADDLVIAAVRAFLEEEARVRRVRVLSTDVRRLLNADDEVDEIVVSQTVDLGADAALRYWDEIGLAIEGLARRLPNDQAGILRERIAINVEWRDAV